MELAVKFSGVRKRYPGARRDALVDVSVSIPRGGQVALVGRSGSGKSTFLHLAAAIDVPSEGSVEIAGRDTSTIDERERTLLRRDHVGLVFQFFHLLPHLSVVENVLLPAMIARDAKAYEARALGLLERVGLVDRADDSAEKLSGGEMQRVAICRALLRSPRLLLADEPTGNLDDATGEAVMGLLTEVTREHGATLLFATHSIELAQSADEILGLHSGELTVRSDRPSRVSGG